MQNPFRLTRWFAILGLLTTALVSVASSLLLSRFLVGNLLRQDANVSMEFVQGIVEVQHARSYFTREREADNNLVEFFDRIATMPDVVRANVFSRDRTIIWSSDSSLIGMKFEDNPELDEALHGKLHVGVDTVGTKAEHALLPATVLRYVENYLPVRSGQDVVGVIEVYKNPRALFEAIEDGTRLVWWSGVGGGLFLYGLLLWVVRRADRIIQSQQARLVESETLAALGVMASAVAHGIRNPLASIRTSAELNLDSPSATVRESSGDIVDEVDGLERWVRDLLAYAVPESGEPENVQIAQVLDDSLGSFARVFQRRAIRVATSSLHEAPAVRGDAALLTQVFNCLLTNAMDAMPSGGLVELAISKPPDEGKLRISISDNGAGVAPEELPNVFVPRRSTKSTGLGVGLPLAKRIVERFGGAIELVGRATGGATVNVDLVIAR
ncbi:two-component sensor histidine kinase [Ramlibacter sp. CGMCC 1.13660]|nr:two-component sensor histidine kinase [Ramlibacter sp. CGMCC 1.13660]